MIYYAIIAMLICLTYLEWSGEDYNILGDKNIEKYCYVVMATLLTLIAALRYETGKDWWSYVPYFENCLNTGYSGEFEVGYYWLNVISKLFFYNYYVMQFIITFICSCVICKYFYIKSQKPLFVLLLYCLFFYFFEVNMAVQRQEIAIAIIIFGMRYVERKNIFPWIITILFAMQFHMTSILVFPLYYTTNWKISKRMAFMAIIFILIVELFGRSFIMYCLNYVLQFAWLPNRANSKILMYIASTQHGGKLEYGTGLGAIVKYLLCFIMLIFYKPNIDKYMSNFLVAMLWIAIGRNFGVLGRVNYYYMICGCGITVYSLLNREDLPNSFSFSKKSNSMVCCALLTLCLLVWCLQFYKTFEIVEIAGNVMRDAYIPYKTFIFRGIKL